MKYRHSEIVSNFIRIFLLAIISFAECLFNLNPAQAVVISPMDQPALTINYPQHVAFIALAHMGARFVAVGEHGVIIVSDDYGTHWRQVASPVSVTLTSVHFVTSAEAFATGQFGVVLRTRDGGKTWTRVLDGITAAKLAVVAAEQMVAVTPQDPNAVAALAEARRLVVQGPDKPFFDSYFSDANDGFVVGAYNLIYRTTDGGSSWTAWMSHTNNTRRLHLYAIAADSSDIYIAGEQGLVLRSLDGGQSFQQLITPYAGSFFAIATAPSGEVVIAGLEGNAFRSYDSGATWQQMTDLPPVGLVSVAFSDDRKLWLANLAGQIFFSVDGGKSMVPLPSPPGPPSPPITSILPFSNAIHVSTFAGVDAIELGNEKAPDDTPSNGS